MTRLKLLALVAILAAVAISIPIASQKTSAGSLTFIVNSLADDNDGSCDDSPGDCTLREAILAANTDPGMNSIHFDLPNCPPQCTILTTDTLPNVEETTTIDGFTQLSGGNSLSTAGTAPVVTIDGTSAPHFANAGIQFHDDNNILRGLILTHFYSSAVNTGDNVGTLIEDNIIIDTGSGNGAISLPGQNHIVRNNLVVNAGITGSHGPGIDAAFGGASGTLIEGNTVTNPSTDGIRVGGPDHMVVDNIIDGSSETGINGAFGSGTDNLVVSGNEITNSGSSALDLSGNNLTIAGNTITDSNTSGSNFTAALELALATSTVSENTISANHGDGLMLFGGSSSVDIRDNEVSENTITENEGFGISTFAASTTIADNFISGNDNSGIEFGGDGSSLLRNEIAENGEHGVLVIEAAQDLLIGGPDGGNHIHDNGAAGVFLPPEEIPPPGAGSVAISGESIIPPPVSVRISQNSIHDNGGLGIDLAPEGPTENDPGDSDDGPNRLQNAPVLTSAIAGGSIEVSGVLDSTSGMAHRIEFFINDSCDPSGFGEGVGYLTERLVTPGGQPEEFSFTLAEDAEPGTFLTATATNLTSNDTSEFSNCIEVTEGGAESPTPTTTPSGSPTATATPTPSPTMPSEQTVAWGDDNCSGQADPVDALLTLRHDAGLSANTGECPAMGTSVGVTVASTRLWGDIDCSEAIDPIDALKLLRFDAALSVSQGAGCPALGAEVTITQS